MINGYSLLSIHSASFLAEVNCGIFDLKSSIKVAAILTSDSEITQSGIVKSSRYILQQHHLRELKALIEHEQEWAVRMNRFLKLALRYRHWYDKNHTPQHRLNQFDKIYERIVNDGLIYHESLPPNIFSKKVWQEEKKDRA